MSFKTVELKELVLETETWNPNKSKSNDPFKYIDIGAIDTISKKIVEPKEVKCHEAPSRARQKVLSGDVLVSTVRPNLNGVAVVPKALDGATASTGFCVLRANSKVLDANYLFHFVRSPAFVNYLTENATGASYPAVSDRVVMESKLPTPSISEQKTIAEKLTRVTDIQSKRSSALNDIDNYLNSYFIEMFGEPLVNPNKYRRVKLGDVIEFAKDGPHVSPKYAESGVPFLSTRNIRPGKVIWDDLKYLSEKEAEIHWKKCKPQVGDILYTKGGTTGFAKVIDFQQPIAVWVHLALLRPKSNLVNSIWLESVLNSAHCYEQSQFLTKGIANRDLGLKRMVEIEFLLPPLNEQLRFERVYRAVEKIRLTAEKSNQEINQLFNSLLDESFSEAR